MKIGIDLGGSHIAIGVVNSKGEILEKVGKRLSDIEKQDVKKAIEEFILEKVNELKRKYEIEEMGIGMPRMGRKWNSY